MLKKVFVALTMCLCVIGISLSSGCGSKPGKPMEGSANKKDLGDGKSHGTTEDGEELPEGLIKAD